jgi:hypothetical protein
MESKGNVVMSRTRKMLAGTFIVLSLVGIGGAGQGATVSADTQVSAHRWCC